MLKPSSQLKKLFFVSLVLIYLHGIEEIITSFAHQDSFMIFGASLFNTSTESFYWISHILWWLLLPILYLIFVKTKFALTLMALFSLVFITELHHVVKAIVNQNYYPGLITASLYLVLGVFFWKELFQNFQLMQRKS